MASTKDLEQQLSQKEAAYNQAIKEGGTLASDITKAWDQAGAADMNALKKKQTELLTNYIAAYPQARENLQNVWNPFTRDRLAAEQVQTTYRPLADIQNEFAVRAKALNLATQSATGLYQSKLQGMQNDINFTQGAYQRAFQRDQAAAAASRARSGGSSRSTKAQEPATLAKDDISRYINSGAWRKEFDTENSFFPALIQAYPEIDPEILKKWTYDARKPFEG